MTHPDHTPYLSYILGTVLLVVLVILYGLICFIQAWKYSIEYEEDEPGNGKGSNPLS